MIHPVIPTVNYNSHAKKMQWTQVKIGSKPEHPKIAEGYNKAILNLIPHTRNGASVISEQNTQKHDNYDRPFLGICLS